MVVEEVPPSRLNASGVGVKRSREQANQPAIATAKVRPALDADPAEVSHGPTMDKQGRGTPSRTPGATSPHPLTERPPSLLLAPLPSQSLRCVPPACSRDGLTHGMCRDSL